MNLLLKFTVNLVEHFKTNQLIADFKLITVLQIRFIDRPAVKQRAVSRAKIRKAETLFTGSLITFCRDPRMEPRRASVIHAHVSIERSPDRYLGALQRYGNRQ